MSYIKSKISDGLMTPATDDDAEDILQAAIISAWRHMQKWEPKLDGKPIAPFNAWFARVLSCRCADFLRQKKRCKEVTYDPLWVRVNGATAIPTYTNSSAAPSGTVEGDDPPPAEPLTTRWVEFQVSDDDLFHKRRLALDASLQAISANQRQLIELVYYDGATHAAAARKMRISATAFKLEHDAALRTMRKVIKRCLTQERCRPSRTSTTSLTLL